MSFQLHQLDTLSYDEAEPILDDYINAALTAFVNSQVGNAYVQQHPEGGGWIGEFIFLSYSYAEMTLPKMTKGQVKTVMESIFPRKITLLDPSDADDAIPELVAFWQFLHQEYKLRSAGAIIKYLQTLEHKFPEMMSDPNRGGFAKQFLLAGMEAGFDMTTQEGVEAFQNIYNQQVRSPNLPPGIEQALNAMLGDVGEPASRFSSETETQDLIRNIASLLMSAPMLDDRLMDGSSDSFFGEINERPWQNAAETLELLTPEAIARLEQQNITETTPGTILADFQTLLDFVGDGVKVSATYYNLPLKHLRELNQRLSRPLAVDLKRPQQKSYASIHGLYLLLRTSGLGTVVFKGKTPWLTLDAALHRQWQSMNPTERYFTLLEAWMLRANAEILGEERNPHTEGSRVLDAWRLRLTPNTISTPDYQKTTFKDYNAQQALNYWPGYHNVALLELFGMLEVTHGKPDPGKGWRIKKIQRSPWGDAIIGLILQAYRDAGMCWRSRTDSTLPFNELQPGVQPYFPQWKAVLTPPQPEFRSGVYTFQVTLRKAKRKLAISSDQTLADLSHLILRSVEFDSDHLDQYEYKTPQGRTVCITHPYADGSPSTNEIQIGSLPLAIGEQMRYVFDFGDWWEFQVVLEAVDENDTRSNYGEILERKGKAPEQYPDDDDGW